MGARGRAALAAAALVFAAGLATATAWYPGERPGVAPLYERVADRVGNGDLPYRDFFLEYPPGAVPFLLAPALIPGVGHGWAFVALAAAALAAGAAIGTITAERPRRAASLAAVFVPALGPVAVMRYDAFVALAVAAGIVLLGRGRGASAGAVLAAAIAAKLYPLTLLPIAAVTAGRGSGLRRAVLALVAVGAAFALPFAILAPGGVRASLEYQLERPLHLESLAGSLLLLADGAGLHAAEIAFEAGAQAVTGDVARALSLVQVIVLALAVSLIAIGFARTRASLPDVVSAAAATLAAVVALGSTLSPQFLVWLFPLLLIDARTVVPLLLLPACVATQVLYPNRYEELVDAELLPTLLLVARNACLVVLALVLFVPWLRAAQRRGAGRP